jgi:threonine dehydratase
MTDADHLSLPGVADIRAAASLLTHEVRRTPVFTSSLLDEWAGAEIYFKAEHLQRSGAFKYRGALHAVTRLTAEQADRGVAAHSSGNHAGALARAARRRGITAHLVMPTTTPAVKRAAVETYGGHVIECEPALAARRATLARVLTETGAVEVHPYDNVEVIAGAGTAALELLAQVPDLDLVVAPVGGGGLLSGTAIVAAGARRAVAAYGAEPAGADDAARSLRGGTLVDSVDPDTVADGLRTSLSARTFRAVQAHVTDIVTVGDDATLEAMGLVWRHTKQLVEPSAAVAVAATPLLAERHRRQLGRPPRIGVILSGGNVEVTMR